jgi:hypothetical protein
VKPPAPLGVARCKQSSVCRPWLHSFLLHLPKYFFDLCVWWICEGSVKCWSTMAA